MHTRPKAPGAPCNHHLSCTRVSALRHACATTCTSHQEQGRRRQGLVEGSREHQPRDWGTWVAGAWRPACQGWTACECRGTCACCACLSLASCGSLCISCPQVPHRSRGRCWPAVRNCTKVGSRGRRCEALLWTTGCRVWWSSSKPDASPESISAGLSTPVT